MNKERIKELKWAVESNIPEYTPMPGLMYTCPGKQIKEDLLALLAAEESRLTTIDPQVPPVGTRWKESGGDRIRQWTGTEWEEIPTLGEQIDTLESEKRLTAPAKIDEEGWHPNFASSPAAGKDRPRVTRGQVRQWLLDYIGSSWPTREIALSKWLKSIGVLVTDAPEKDMG